MSRVCGKRLIVAMAGIAAFAWLGAGCASKAPVAASAPPTPPTKSEPPAFARIVVSENSVVYIVIQETDSVDVGSASPATAPRMAMLRAATSAEGLNSSEAIEHMTVLVLPHGSNSWTSSEFTLPIPADQLPAGVTAIKASLAPGFAKAGLAPEIGGRIKIYRTDDRKAVWQYTWQSGPFAAGTTAEHAPAITLPDLDKVKLNLEATSSNGRLAAGLRLTASSATLTEVSRDGQPVQVKMVVTDASGAEIASKVGTLADFGFS